MLCAQGGQSRAGTRHDGVTPDKYAPVLPGLHRAKRRTLSIESLPRRTTIPIGDRHLPWYPKESASFGAPALSTSQLLTVFVAALERLQGCRRTERNGIRGDRDH